MGYAGICGDVVVMSCSVESPFLSSSSTYILFAVFHYLFGHFRTNFRIIHQPFSKVLVIWDASPKPPKPSIIKSTSSTYRFKTESPIDSPRPTRWRRTTWRPARPGVEVALKRRNVGWETEKWQLWTDNVTTMWQHIWEKINIKKETVYTLHLFSQCEYATINNRMVFPYSNKTTPASQGE